MSNIKKNIIKINGETLISNDFIRNPNLTGNEKMMYLILACHCPAGSNKCNPSIKRELTSDSGMSSKTIIALLKSLKNKGFIEIEKNTDKFGGQLTNSYILK